MDVVGGELVALNELLSGCQDAQDEYEERQNQSQHLTPSTLGGPASAKLPEVTRPIGQIQPEDPKAIWSMDEVPSDDEDDDAFDSRSRPEFEILYKQSVMTEDVFLGLGNKDPSSSHCEAMVVRIHCPEHRLEDVELEVKKHRLVLLSSTLKLALHLPHPVRHLDGRAKWNQKTQTMDVTLPIVRDEW